MARAKRDNQDQARRLALFRFAREHGCSMQDAARRLETDTAIRTAEEARTAHNAAMHQLYKKGYRR